MRQTGESDMTDERKKKKDQPLTKAQEVELGLRKKISQTALYQICQSHQHL